MIPLHALFDRMRCRVERDEQGYITGFWTPCKHAEALLRLRDRQWRQWLRDQNAPVSAQMRPRRTR